VIITKTPFRISFFGGGTDYPKYFKEHGGSVLSASIDKYAYITCRQLPPFFKHKHRVVYSKIEEVDSIDEINHPAVKAILSEMKITDGIEIHYDGDLPARSGVGSSSSFTVGLLNALENYKKK
jgi:D-glycero-alpha-D-manno-heptose-7-phosphate kinase